MKKITFILFALITGTTFAQEKATESATVHAEIVMPISIENTRGLNFGRLIGTAGSATVASTATGERTGDSDVLAVTGNGSTAPQSGVFAINAADGYTYSVTLDAPENLQIGTEGATLAVSFTHNLEDTGNAGAGTTDIPLYLGGTVTLVDQQAEGNYSGTVGVTVAYE
jgi:hypothetical protein